MTETNDLLRMRYLKGEYFRGGEKDCLLTRSIWFKALEEELELWDDEKYMNLFPKFSRLKREIFFNALKLGSKIYHSRFSPKNKKIMWIGQISNKDFLFKSQPYNLVISDIRLSRNKIFQLLFTPNISLYPIYKCYTDLFSGIINDDENLLQKGLDKLKDIFKRVNPDLIVLDNDIFPPNQAIVLIARELCIPTVEIQHGVYVDNITPTGRDVDYVFVWGQRFKDLYVRNKIKKADQVKIMGYPYQIDAYDNLNKEKKLIIYLGQNYEVYYESLLYNKIETIKKIQIICDKLNFDFVYRPHPGDYLDLLKSEIKDVNFTPPRETLQETFEKGDIFISFDSTALIEASLHSKLGVQLKNYNILTDDFEKVGACSKSVETFEELESYLEQIKNEDLFSFYLPVKESYMEVPQDPGRRFLELIKEII